MGLLNQSWYISRYEDGLNCEEYFLNSLSFTPSMRNTISAIVEMFLALRDCQLSHGKCKASNILIVQNRPCLIDLDTMFYHGNKRKAEQNWRKDIQTFMENWWERHDIDKQFRLAFAKQGVEL
jgi:serine/threonine-protein kinase RIO1